jgi:hypothetical protein
VGNTPRVPDYLRGPYQTKYNMSVANIAPAYADLGIQGNRTMQMGLKLYF